MKLIRLLPLFMAVFLQNCGSDAEIGSASKTIDRYYTAMKESRPDDAARFFTADFAARNPPESWNETVSGIQSVMGNLLGWNRIPEKSHYYTSTAGNEDTVVLIYTTRYEKHFSRELFTLVKDRKTGEYRICGMDITAKGISAEGK